MSPVAARAREARCSTGDPVSPQAISDAMTRMTEHCFTFMQPFWLRELPFGEFVKEPGLRHQLVVGPALHDPTFLDDVDPVGVTDRAEAVGDHDSRGAE